MQHSFLSLGTWVLFNKNCKNCGFLRLLRLWILNCIISRVLIWIASWSIKKRAVIWPLGFFKSQSCTYLASLKLQRKVSIWRCVRREDICKSRNYRLQHMSDTALKNCQVEKELKGGCFFRQAGGDRKLNVKEEAKEWRALEGEKEPSKFQLF